MTKQDYKELGDECFNHLKEINPNGGMKEFIRIAVEFGYKRAVKKLTIPVVDSQREQLLDFANHLFEGHDIEVEKKIVDNYLKEK